MTLYRVAGEVNIRPWYKTVSATAGRTVKKAGKRGLYSALRADENAKKKPKNNTINTAPGAGAGTGTLCQ